MSSHASIFLFTSLKNLSTLLYRTGYNLTDFASNSSTEVIASAILLVIFSAEVWVEVTCDWLRRLGYVGPVLTSENCDTSISISTSRHRKNKHVRFSYAYAYVAGVLTCLCLGYAYACAYALVRTSLGWPTRICGDL